MKASSLGPRHWQRSATALLLLLWAGLAVAGDGTPVLRSRTPCAMPEGHYADYQTRAVQQWQTDDRAAKAAGLQLRPQSELLPALWTAAVYS